MVKGATPLSVQFGTGFVFVGRGMCCLRVSCRVSGVAFTEAVFACCLAVVALCAESAPVLWVVGVEAALYELVAVDGVVVGHGAGGV